MSFLQQPLLALTIDDAPDGAGTDAYFTLLQQFAIPATFFLIGSQIAKYPEQILTMHQLGYEIGNHSMNHLDLTTLSEAQIRQELSELETALQKVLPVVPPMTVRAPYFAYNETLSKTVSAPLIDAACTEKGSLAETIASLTQAKDGDVILVHSWNRESCTALQMVLPKLLQSGFRFVTIHDLFALRGVPPVHGTVYRNLPATCMA